MLGIHLPLAEDAPPAEHSHLEVSSIHMRKAPDNLGTATNPEH